jgi:hypothetical protein
MTSHFIVFLITVPLAAAIFVLFLCGLLVRNDVERAAAEKQGARRPVSRILDDLRPVQDIVVAFIAASDPSAQLLERLDQHERYVGLHVLFDSSPLAGERRPTLQPAPKNMWTALFIMTVAGLVRFGTRGIALTSVGREVLARIRHEGDGAANGRLLTANSMAATGEPGLIAVHSDRKAHDNDRPHLSRVREAMLRRDSDRLLDQVAVTSDFRIGQLRERPDSEILALAA